MRARSAPTIFCASPSTAATWRPCWPRRSAVPDVAWRIRAASTDDRDALQALWREIDELHTTIVPSFFGWAEDRSELAMRRALADHNEMLLVADEDGAVRGLAHVILYDTPPGGGRRQTRRAHLDSLVVHRGHRRRG